jgi:hypothetical protein
MGVTPRGGSPVDELHSIDWWTITEWIAAHDTSHVDGHHLYLYVARHIHRAGGMGLSKFAYWSRLVVFVSCRMYTLASLVGL